MPAAATISAPTSTESDVSAETSPAVDPASADSDAVEADALQDLGDEIATLAAQIHAATHRLLELIREFDRRRGWERAGFRSCAHWLAFRTGMRAGAARERVRAARALERLPLASAAMARGELSFAKVRALTRVATPESEAELLEYARSTTAAGLERLVRGWRMLGAADEEELERRRRAARRFSVAPDLDGTYVVRGRLEPEVAAVLMRAVEAASDALYRRERTRGAADGSAPGEPDDLEPDTDREAARRRADALGLIAERALAAGFGGEGGGEGEAAGGETADGEAADGEAARGGRGAPVSGSRAERYQVVLHVDEGVLARDDERGRAEAAPRSHLDDGTRVSAETSRRLTCDAAVVRVRHGDGPSTLDIGRRTRTVPPALRRALELRDRGCRFPGCGLRFTDAHHVRHWADGGETRLDNLVLLCRRHHRAVHQEGFRIEMGPTGQPTFHDPRGLPLPEAPPPLVVRPLDTEPAETSVVVGGSARAAAADPVESLVRANRARGVRPDWRTASARWKRDSDIPQGVIGGALGVLEAAAAGSGS